MYPQVGRLLRKREVAVMLMTAGHRATLVSWVKLIKNHRCIICNYFRRWSSLGPFLLSLRPIVSKTEFSPFQINGSRTMLIATTAPGHLYRHGLVRGVFYIVLCLVIFIDSYSFLPPRELLEPNLWPKWPTLARTSSSCSSQKKKRFLSFRKLKKVLWTFLDI